MSEPRQTFVMPAVNREVFLSNLVNRLARLPERRWAISIEPSRKLRSTDQNNLLWRLYRDILAMGGEALKGWRVEDLHEYMLGECFGWDTIQGLGRRRIRPNKRSSKLSTAEFKDFLEFICQRMAEHGVVLTLPGEVDGAN
jgi:hypothetical protein